MGSLGRGAIPLTLGLAACEPTTGTNALVGDSGFGEETDDRWYGTTDPDPATQVGSEGFWDCPTEREQPVADPGAPIPSLGGASAIDLTAAHVGSWPLQIVDPVAKATLTGSLDLAATDTWRWVEVAAGVPGCVDYLEADVTGALLRDGSPSNVLGVVAIRSDAARLLATDTGELSATAAVWGVPAIAGVIGFRVEADLTPATLDGHAAYVDCTPSVVDCPNRQVVGQLSSAR